MYIRCKCSLGLVQDFSESLLPMLTAKQQQQQHPDTSFVEQTSHPTLPSLLSSILSSLSLSLSLSLSFCFCCLIFTRVWVYYLRWSSCVCIVVSLSRWLSLDGRQQPRLTWFRFGLFGFSSVSWLVVVSDLFSVWCLSNTCLWLSSSVDRKVFDSPLASFSYFYPETTKGSLFVLWIQIGDRCCLISQVFLPCMVTFHHPSTSGRCRHLSLAVPGWKTRWDSRWMMHTTATRLLNQQWSNIWV